jgi:hypothetical protein
LGKQHFDRTAKHSQNLSEYFIFEEALAFQNFIGFIFIFLVVSILTIVLITFLKLLQVDSCCPEPSWF